MRSNLIARRKSAFSKASALIAVAIVSAACSSDANRLDQLLTASISQTDNQQQIVSAKPAAQAFPDDVQVIRRSATPLAPTPLAAPVSRAVLPPVNQTSVSATLPSTPIVVQPAPQAAPSATPPTIAKGALVLQPINRTPKPLTQASSDEITTGSVVPVISGSSKPTQKTKGWDKSKGATVTVRPGETLHNLSRRYGVPVKAIIAANNLRSANHVVVGSRILIPSYNYAESLEVSAPDSNPTTKASRASTGFQGQARGVVAVPKSRGKQPVIATTTKAIAPIRKTKGAVYTVTSGDTLYGVSKRHGVSSGAILQANNLSDKGLRIGQKLIIPGATNAIVAQQPKIEPVLDHSTTGSIAVEESKPKTIKPVIAKPEKQPDPVVAKAATEKPEKSIIRGNFGWPARGRLISKFGERNESGANDGIDIAVPNGTPIKASDAGTVIYSGSELEDFGKLILVSHKGGWVSAYAHASNTLVRRGQKVTRGQVIAKSGQSGNASIPKVHFELRKNSNPVNPLRHLMK